MFSPGSHEYKLLVPLGWLLAFVFIFGRKVELRKWTRCADNCQPEHEKREQAPNAADRGRFGLKSRLTREVCRALGTMSNTRQNDTQNITADNAEDREEEEEIILTSANKAKIQIDK